jgi:hypothetical protein
MARKHTPLTSSSEEGSNGAAYAAKKDFEKGYKVV